MYLVKLESVNLSHLALVGGKNASLGEMIQHLSAKGVNVISGYATTTTLYQDFLKKNNLEKIIAAELTLIDSDNVELLETSAKKIRNWILQSEFPPEFEQEFAVIYDEKMTVAVRSSATAEDLATASFAGQQETYLNIKGLKSILQAIKMVFASLFTARAIAYRLHQGIHSAVAISAGIQPMVRSDKGVSGVMFTLDTETGFDDVVLISASYGLGEAIVQGKVNPDEFFVSKSILKNNKRAILQRRLGSKAVKMVYTNLTEPGKSIRQLSVPKLARLQFSLTDEEIELLAKQALLIEEYYGKPMDIEWAKDGLTNQFVILQARPETVKSQGSSAISYQRYYLSRKSNVLAQGQSVGQSIGKGIARIILDPKNMGDVKQGEIIVTDMTDPDWEPVIKRAAAIVTNRGGRTCHAAIIAREMGIPAIVGCDNATETISNNLPITVSCAEGQIGYVYDGLLDYQVKNIPVNNMTELPAKLCINLGNPEKAFSTRFLPNNGIGLARLEFIISNAIGIHPNALLNYDSLPPKLQKQIRDKTLAYKSPLEFYIEKLCEGIAMIAAAFFPKQVIFRFSDFKSNEYANLLGGNLYEPHEENPMLGFRGSSRYTGEKFKAAFALECEAFKRVRNQMGLTNAQMMIPFVRTVNELKEVMQLLEANDLKRTESLKIFMMCEIPSNALLAAEFLPYVDGFSIGSNDLTQLTLGLDRDSNLVSHLFDERDQSVKMLLSMAIKECKKQGKYIGICGQGPSDHLDFAKWLMDEGIENISLNPDTIVETWTRLSEYLSQTTSEKVILTDVVISPGLT